MKPLGEILKFISNFVIMAYFFTSILSEFYGTEHIVPKNIVFTFLVFWLITEIVCFVIYINMEEEIDRRKKNK